MIRNHSKGFSLVEVTLAIGIIAFALIAIFGLIPVGSKSARDSIDATRTAMIVQTVVNRIRTSMMSNDPNSSVYFAPYSSDANSFFFFTSDGLATGELLKVNWQSTDQPAYYQNVKTTADFYRVKVHVSTFDQNPNYVAADPRYWQTGSTNWNLLCAAIEIGWPIDTTNGSVISSSSNAAKFSYSFLLRKP